MSASVYTHEPWNDEERGELARARESRRSRVQRLLFMAATLWISVALYGFGWGVL